MHPHPFNQQLLRQRRSRKQAGFAQHNLIHAEIASRLSDDLQCIKRDFKNILQLFASNADGLLLHSLYPAAHIVRMDAISGGDVIADADILPFAPESFDVILGNLGLELCNDIPGFLAQARRTLKPDGLLHLAILGSDSFNELRQSLLQAEIDITGGAGSRFIPLPTLQDCAGLLQRAELALPVAHQEIITLDLKAPLDLMAHIRSLGLANFSHSKTKKPLSRKILARALEIYAQSFAADGGNGRVRATLQIIYLSAWAPAQSQPKALRPGSAKTRLADALDTMEMGAGERVKS